MAFPQAVPSEQTNGRADAGTVCAYCGVLRAVNRDHVIPRSLRRKLPSRAFRKAFAGAGMIPTELLRTVPSCFTCNIRKGARRLVPPSWAKHIEALNELIPGTPWRVWHGDPQEPAYRGAWK